MVNIGNVNTMLHMAQNVILKTNDAASPSAADDAVVTLSHVGFSGDLPETRTNFGTSKTYTYGSPDIALYFTAAANSSLLEYMAERQFVRNTRNVPTAFRWQIEATDNSGTKRTVVFTGVVIHFDFAASVASQEEPAEYECRIRVQEESVSVT